MSDTARSYNKNAADYERRWAAYLEHTHSRFIERLNFSETDYLLDLSCGTGLLAGKLLENEKRFGQLTLNDPAEKMLNIARSRFSSHPRIRFSGAAAHELPFRDNSFDLILSLSAFHNYRYQHTVIAEIGRLLKPGGRIYLQDWNRSGFFRPLNALIRRWAPEHIDTRSLDEIKQMLEQQRFSIEQEESWRYRYWKFFFAQALC